MNILVSLMLMMAPAVKLESSTFTIYQNGVRIGSETFKISARQGGYLAEGETQTTRDPVSIKSRMELDEKLRPISYEFHHGQSTIKLKIESPISEYESNVSGKTDSFDFRFPENGFIIDNNLFHHYLLLLYRVAGETSVPIFVPQDLLTGSAKITPKSNRMFELEVGEVKLEATTDAEGRLIRLAMPEAKVVVER